MTERFYSPVIKYTTSNLTSLPGALLYFYETGTSTPKTTWTDPERATASAHPVVALSDGTFPPIFINGVYRVELKSAAGVTQPGWPVDDVGSPAAGFPFQSWSSTYSYSEDDLVTYGGEFYQSLDDDNVGNTPSTSPAFWQKKLFLDAPTAESYLNGNADGTYTWHTLAQTKSNLSLPTDTVSELALRAPLASPAFTGNPTAPTPSANDNDTSIATTAYVQTELLARVQTVATFADLATLTGFAGQTVFVNGVAAEGYGAGNFTLKTGSVATVNGIRRNIATANVYAERVDIGGYTIEMAGGRDDGVVDNKAPHEIIRGLGKPVLMMGNGTYLFSAPPTLPSTANTILNGAATLSGATAAQLNATIIKDGNWCGMPFAQAIRDKRIGIVCGTIRAHQPQAVVSITRSGSTATVTHIAHGYSTGMPAVIAGANETEYNTAGSSPTTITVIDPDTYTYTVSGTPASPATGTITSRNPSWWFYINDADHTPLGMTTSGIYNPITGTSSLLTLGMDNTYTKVLSVVVCPDETLSSAQGMSIGPSVSLNGIALRASCDRTFAYEILYNSGTGLWSFSSSTGQDLLESFTYASGNLVINHKYCPKVNLQLTPYSRNGTVVPYIPVIKALTNTSFTVNFLDYVSGGLVVTTADDKMSMYASKNFNNLVPFDGSSGSWSIPFYLGNIWFLGIMQY